MFNWLDTQLEITEDKSNCIDQTRLEKQIIFNYFEFFDSEIFNSKNIDFVKKVLKVYVNISISNIEINTNYIILLSKDNNIIYHIIYMMKYYPYKSDKPNKNITLLQMIIKKFILVLVDIVILLFIKMKQENKDI